MKKQDYVNLNSEILKKYLNNIESFHFEQHGYDDAALKNSNMVVETQKRALHDLNNPGEIWFSTEIGQPFLFWNKKNELDISGILDYDYKSQLGTFQHDTISGELHVENVHSYFVLFNIQISNNNYKYMPFFSKYVPEYEESKDIYVPMIVQNEDNSFTLQLYHNTTMEFQYQNVYPELYFEYGENTAYKNRLAYFRFSVLFGKYAYHNYLFDITNMKLIKMDDSKEVPSFYIDYRAISKDFNGFYSNILNDFESKLKGKTLSIIFHMDNSKTAAIVAEFVKNADEYEVLKNIFDDDDTKNIKVTYIDRPEDVRFLYYCFNLNESLLGGAIFEKGISDYIIGTKNYIKEYKVMLTCPENEIEYYKMMVRQLYQRCDEQMSINRLPKKIYENYIEGFRMFNILHRYCYAYDNIWGPPSLRENKLPLQHFIMKDKSKIFEKEKIKYDAIYQQLIKRDKLPVQWKNEYSLYKLLLKKYPDAIYQYHCAWLDRQSLDIYIPSMNLAFEYQGEQHYRSVDFFGGETGLSNRVKLDEKKRKLCKENNVKLVEWKYDEPITKKALEIKLTQLG